jgi:hypothetical protein
MRFGVGTNASNNQYGITLTSSFNTVLGNYTTDGGQKLQVNGTSRVTGHGIFETSLSVGTSGAFGAFTVRGGDNLSSSRAIVVQNLSQSLIFSLSNDGTTFINPQGAGNILVGNIVDNGTKFQVGGNSFIKGSVSSSASSALIVQNSNAINLLNLRNDGFLDCSSGVGYRFSDEIAFSNVSGGSFVTGYRSSATGNYSFSANGGRAGIGGSNNATTDFSATFGRQTNAYLLGQFAHSNYGISNVQGDSQHSFVQLVRIITGTTIQELFIDGATARAILPTTNSMWNVKLNLIAVCSVAGGTTVLGDVFTGQYFVTIKRVGGTTSIVGSVSTDEKSNTSMSTSVVTIDADTTNNSLRVRFTPPTTSGGTTVIRVVSTLHLTEMRY